MTIAKGNTYNAKDYLKKVGFAWNAEEKRWEAESFDKETWKNKYCDLTWQGRKREPIVQAVTFEQM